MDQRVAQRRHPRRDRAGELHQQQAAGLARLAAHLQQLDPGRQHLGQ
jgi:hypothetical protein